MSKLCTWCFTMAILAGLMTGCGGSEEQGGQAASSDAPVQVQVPVGTEQAVETPAKPEVDESTMAEALVSGKASAAIDLKYEIMARPEPGEAFEVALSFAPRLAADELRIEVTGVEGLTVAGGASHSFAGVQAGERYRTTSLIQAATAGLYYLTVSAQMITAVQTEARVFSVPVVVGAPVEQARSEAPRDATGQPIHPMKAEESADAN